MVRWLLTSILALLWATGLAGVAADADALATGIDLYNKGHFVQALRHLGAAQKTPSTMPRALYYRALVEFKLSKTTEATDTLRALVSVAPGSPEAALAQKYLQNLAQQQQELVDFATLPKHAKIPFRVARDDSMHVTAYVNGRSVDMIWDTGATNCSLPPSAFADLPEQGVVIPVETPKGMTLARKASVQIACGELQRKVATTIMDGEAVIGQSFFKDYKVEFNKDLRYIYLDYVGTTTGGKQKTAATKFQVPFTRESGIMVVEIEIEGQPVKAYFDTGCAASGIAMSAQLARSFGNRHRVQVAIGPIERKDVRVTVADGMSRPLIGPAVFGDRGYKIDPANQVIDFDYSRE